MNHRPRVAVLAVAVGSLVNATTGAPAFQIGPADPPARRTLIRAWNVSGEAVGSPAVDDQSAYFLSRSHEVVAVDAATGRTRWRQPTNESGYGGTGAGVVVSGAVVVAGDYDLVAFDRLTGDRRWRFEPPEGYGPGFYMAFSATDGVVYTGSPSGRVYAVEAETGRLRWSTVVAADGKTTVFPPRFGNGLVATGYTEFVAPNRGGLVLIDAAMGRVRWKRPFPLPQDRSLSVNWAGGPVFTDALVVVSSGDGRVHAYDIDTGDERWSLPPIDVPPGTLIDPRRDFRGLAISNDLLVSGSLTGVVVAYDIETRTERWRYAGDHLGSVMFRIEADNELVYVPFAGGTLVALGARDGREAWRVGDWLSSLLWPPALWRDLVVVSGAVDGFSAFRMNPEQ